MTRSDDPDSRVGPVLRPADRCSWPVLLFPSTHQALAAEEVLRRAAVRIEVIPVPPQVAAGCGLAIRLAADDAEAACAVLHAEAIRYTLHRTTVD